MSVRALNIGVTGLRAQGEAIGVVGDNIANVNTPGFKRQRTVFEDMFNGGGQGGAGTRLHDINQAFTQGSLVQTGVASDVALNGNGFFIVAGNVNGVTGTFYSRAGQFQVDARGSLVDPSGLQVMGRTAQPDGTLSASLGALTVPTGAISPQPTTEIGITANLDASEPLLQSTFDPARPLETSTSKTSLVVYDSLGSPHSLDVYLNKLGDNQWEYRVLARGDELNPSQPGTDLEVGSGRFLFTSDGALESFSQDVPVNISFDGATPGQQIAMNFGRSMLDGGTGLDGTTQFAMPTAVSSQEQNGFASGSFSGLSIGTDGTVRGMYSNGRTLAVGQLGVATFRAADSLGRAGNNLWVETTDSGPAAVGTAGFGGRGQVNAGSIEGSNVDMGEEMVSMIQHQRAFSASSRVIATADELLSQLMLIKR